MLQFVLSVLFSLAHLTIHSHSAGENYGSDFSVSTLLHTNPPPADSATTRQGYGNSMAVYDSTPTQPPPPSGWQLLLPSDQGVVESCDHSVGYQPAPNMSLLTHSYTQPHPTGYGHAVAYQLRAPPSYSAAVQQQNLYYAGGQSSQYPRPTNEATVFKPLKQEPRQSNSTGMTAANQYTQDWRSSDIYSNGSTSTSKSITPSPTAENTVIGGNEKDEDNRNSGNNDGNG